MTVTATTPARADDAAPTELPDAFVVRQPAFEGSLTELAYALREGTVATGDLDLYQLVRTFLVYFEGWAETDLNLASEALPGVAQIIELKLRLLLPRPPRVDDDEDGEEELEEALAAVALLDELEQAIEFLRRRRQQRRVTLPARTPRPDFPRPERPLDVGIGALSEIAGRLRSASYFEMAIDRLTLAGAISRLLAKLKQAGRGLLFRLFGARDWATQTVVFTGMLELVREGKITAEQDEPYGDIRIALAGDASRDAAPSDGAGAPDVEATEADAPVAAVREPIEA